MNQRQRRVVGSGLVVAVLATAVWVNAGNLTPPPGPVGDTYPTLGFKTLQQVEPRTPVEKLAGSGTASYVISAAGSYYLTQNLTGAAGKDGIDILADNVTLDLNGFSLVGVPGSGKAITVSNGGPGSYRRNISIKNGNISDWDGDGVDIDLAWQSSVENIRVTQCAVGILMAHNMRVTGCTVQDNLLGGIFGGNGCSVSGCTALFNGNEGIRMGTHASILNCCSEVSDTNNFLAGDAASITNCTSRFAGLSGIFVGDGSALNNCTAVDSGADGIALGGKCAASGCAALRSGGAGISGYNDNTISHCTASDNDFIGVWINGGNVTNCTVNHNGNSGIASFGDTLTISHCNITGNLASGVIIDNGGRVSDCFVVANAGEGIVMLDFAATPTEFGAEISRCVASRNIGNGILVEDGCTVRECTTRLNAGDGVRAGARCLIVDNTCETNGSAAYGFANGAGVHVTGSGNRIESNHAVGNDRGIDVDGGSNFVVKNTASGSLGAGPPSANYDIAAGNNYGAIVAGPGAAFSTVIAGPWSNFAF